MLKSFNEKNSKAMLWSFLTNLAPKLVSPVINMVLARLLAPSAFGAIATINLIITFAEIFTDAGFQKYIVQHEFESDEELDRNTNVAFWTNIVISLVFIAGIVIFRNQIAGLVGSSGLGLAIAISSVNILLVTFSSTQTAIYNRGMDFKTLFLVRMCTVFIPLVITVPLAFGVRNYWALIIGTLTTNLTNAIILHIRSKWKPRLYFNFKLFKEMFGFSAWLLLDSIAIWLSAYIGTFLIGRQLNDYYLGLYKTSISTVGSITGIITLSITPVMFSRLSRCQSNDENMRNTLLTYQRLSAIILLPLGVGFFVFKEFITRVLLGPQWGEAANFIGIWGLTTTIVIIFNNYYSTYFRSKGRPRVAFVLQIIQLCFYVPITIIAAKQDFDTFCYINALSTLFPIIPSTLAMRVLFNFSVKKSIKNVLPMLFSSLLMGVIGHLMKGILKNYLWDLFCIFVCIVLYFLLLFMHKGTRKEIFQLKEMFAKE